MVGVIQARGPRSPPFPMRASSPSSRPTIVAGIPKLPARSAAIVVPLLLSLLMSGVVSAISTLRGAGWTPDFLHLWLGAWMLSWAVAFPLVVVLLPTVRRLTGLVVDLR